MRCKIWNQSMKSSRFSSRTRIKQASARLTAKRGATRKDQRDTAPFCKPRIRRGTRKEMQAEDHREKKGEKGRKIVKSMCGFEKTI
jgi:hypothetical protein